MTLVLALFGVGMTIGNVLGGYAADRALRPTVCVAFLLLAAVLALFAVTARAEWSAALTVVLVGLFGFAIVPAVQTLVMREARSAPTLASATVQGAFNLANAQGAFFGGLALDAGLGWTSPTLVGSGLAASGAVIAVLAWALDRRGGNGWAARRSRAGRSRVWRSPVGRTPVGRSRVGRSQAGLPRAGRSPVHRTPVSRSFPGRHPRATT